MPNYLVNKKILIGITGGIAAYKILDLIRRLKENTAQVKVILTKAGEEFVTPLSIQALGAETEHLAAISHIELARWADIVLIAPATANFIAKYTHGLADDLLSSVCLAATVPVVIAPAMNQQMWQHIATQENISKLQQRGIPIWGPGYGSQACGEFGPGRMLEANELLDLLDLYFAPQLLAGKHLLITAGPTQEQIDPVRYLSNHSSGKMGYALANAAIKLGASVTLISGPCNLPRPNHAHLSFVPVISSDAMFEAVMRSIENPNQTVNIFISCAAVADYKPTQTNQKKIKKNSANLTLELELTQDILAAVAALPAAKRPFTIGFAAETENLIENAKQKLEKKCLDLIIANAVDNGKAFNQDENQVFIVSKNAQPRELPQMSKNLLAFRLLEELVI